LVLLVGVIGGVAMGSVAAARRTQSSYPRFLASTNPSDLTVSIYGFGPTAQATLYSPATTAKIAHLPLVRHVESWAGVFAIPLKADGTPNPLPDINIAGSVDGLYFTQDRATPVAGRMANPARADEFVTTPLGASLLGIHVGELVPFGVLSPGDFGQPGLMTNALPAAKRRSLRLVGLVTFNTEVVEAFGEDRLEAISIQCASTGETQKLPAHYLFIFIGAAPGTDWIGPLVERDDKGFIYTGPDLLCDGKPPKSWPLKRDPWLLESSVPGIFVAGDVRYRSIKRVASGVGEGANAVQFIHQYLSSV